MKTELARRAAAYRAAVRKHEKAVNMGARYWRRHDRAYKLLEWAKARLLDVARACGPGRDRLYGVALAYDLGPVLEALRRGWQPTGGDPAVHQVRAAAEAALHRRRS